MSSAPPHSAPELMGKTDFVAVSAPYLPGEVHGVIASSPHVAQQSIGGPPTLLTLRVAELEEENSRLKAIHTAAENRCDALESKQAELCQIVEGLKEMVAKLTHNCSAAVNSDLSVQRVFKDVPIEEVAEKNAEKSIKGTSKIGKGDKDQKGGANSHPWWRKDPLKAWRPQKLEAVDVEKPAVEKAVVEKADTVTPAPIDAAPNSVPVASGAPLQKPPTSFPPPNQQMGVTAPQGIANGATGSSEIRLVNGVGIYTTKKWFRKKTGASTVTIVCQAIPQATSELLVLDDSKSKEMTFGAKRAYAAYRREFGWAPSFMTVRYGSDRKLSGHSAILGTAVCLAAATENFEVPGNLIITGVVDEAGNVLEILGTEHKAKHAYNNDCALMLPYDNVKDLSNDLKERLTFLPVKTLKQAIEIIKGFQ